MRNYLFVDGSNLYAGQYKLFGPGKYLNFSKFIKDIEKNLNIKFDKIYFYASYSPKPKIISKSVENYLKNEGLFYQSVRKTKNVEFYKGHRSITSGKEKGVDVALASDLVRFSCEMKYKYGYLITGDADFQHCIEIAIEKKRIINIIAIENRVPCRLSILYNTYVFWFKNKPKLFDYRKISFLKSNIDCIEKIKKPDMHAYRAC
jgi:uncharacterized LabA/DUF88 family protein